MSIVECVDAAELAASTAVGRRCFLPPAANASMLPVLSFRLSQHASPLHLPLEALLLPPLSAQEARRLGLPRSLHPAAIGGGARELCVRSQPPASSQFTSRSQQSAAPDWQQPVTFGTSVLQSFVSYFEMLPEQHRVGLAPKYPPPSRPERAARRAASCAARALCAGEQRYAAVTNTCEQPICDAFSLTD